jgi:hypothetical protein
VAERLAGVLAQSLAHLNLGYNYIEPSGAKRLAKGMLGQCTALAHLNLEYNDIGPAGAESFAGVLAQREALAHLDLQNNGIGPDGAEFLAGVLSQCTVLAHLNLRAKGIGTVGDGGFERRDVVKTMDLICRHLALLALCHLLSRQTTRKSRHIRCMLTYSVVAFGLALSL